MDVHEIIRHYFRVSVKDCEDVAITINGHDFELVDIGNSGVGIKLAQEDILPIVEQTLLIELYLPEATLRLEGKTVHITPDNETGEYQGGIEFVDLDDEGRRIIINYLANCRDKLFHAE